MAATGNKSSLYPTVYKGDRGNAQRNGSENGAQVDLLVSVKYVSKMISSLLGPNENIGAHMARR